MNLKWLMPRYLRRGIALGESLPQISNGVRCDDDGAADFDRAGGNGAADVVGFVSMYSIPKDLAMAILLKFSHRQISNGI